MALPIPPRSRRSSLLPGSDLPTPSTRHPSSFRVRDIHRDVPSIAGAITSGDRQRKRSTYATRDSDGPTNRGIALGVVNSKAINVVALVLKVTIVFASIRLLIKFVLLLRTSWIIIISVKLSRQENARIRENPFFLKKKRTPPGGRDTYILRKRDVGRTSERI